MERHNLKVYNAPFGIESLPIQGICTMGSLPENASFGIDVDWSNVTFCSVSQMVAVACVQCAGTSSGVRQKCKLPDSSARSYMQRMDYCKTLGIRSEEAFSRHDPRDRFVPLTKIPIDELEADPGGIADRLEEVVSANTMLHRSASNMLNLAVTEVIDNVVQHSLAKSPGMACAQYYASQGFVELCVADSGIGIPTSMSDNPDYLFMTDGERMLAAFEAEKGQWVGRPVTGSNQVGRGLGLSYPARLAERLGGHLWAISGGTAIHIHNGGREPMADLFYPGTVIVLRVPNVGDEVLESDLWDDGQPRPIYFDAVEGRNYGDDDLLW